MRYILMFAAVLTLAACQKKQCWKCEVLAEQTTGETDTTQVPVCDKTKKEIRSFEDNFKSNYVKDGYWIPGTFKSIDCN